MLKNMKIGQRLLGVSLVIFCAFAVGIVIFKSTLTSTDESYKNLLEKEILIAEKAREVSQLVEKCKRVEESFLRNRNEYDLKAQKETLSKIKGHLNNIVTVDSSINLQKIEEAVQAHENSFRKISSSWKLKGFNQDDTGGLQYKFSTIANELMTKVKKHELENLYIKFMAVRIAEKDYYFKKEAMYKTRLDMALVEFGYEISNLSVSENIKKMYRDSLAEYKEVFKALSTAEGAKRAEQYNKMSNISVKIESQISNLYVPQVRSLILQVRHDEKKYLLEGRKSDLALQQIMASYEKKEEPQVEETENSGGGGGGLLDGLFSEEEKEEEKEVKKARRDMDNFEKTLDSLEALKKGFTDYEDNLSEVDLRSAIDQIENYKELFSGLVKEDDTINLELIELHNSSEKLQTSVDAIVSATEKSLKLKKDEISKDIQSSSKTAIFSSVAAVILGILLFAGVTQSITKPIGNAVEFAEAVANKNLSDELEVKSSDEVGQLAVSLNKASSNLNQSFKIISQKTHLLNDSSQTLAKSSNKFSQSFVSVDNDAANSISSTRNMTENLEYVRSLSDQLKDNSDAVLKRIRKVSNNIDSVSTAVSHSEMNITTISAATEQMSATIAEIAENGENSRQITEEAYSKTDAAYEQVSTLISAAREIEEIVNLIVEISEQTKNLSLNATIEAARAGEAGKGFAVVANEVKTLAGQTSEASEKIRQSILKVGDISKSTTSIMDEVKNIVSQIRDSSNIVASAIEEQNISVKDDAANISEAAAGLTQIATAMNESTELVKETVVEIEGMNGVVNDVNKSCLKSTKENKLIVSSIENIGQSVNTCKDDAEMLKATSENLDEMASGLSKVINDFKLKA